MGSGVKRSDTQLEVPMDEQGLLSSNNTPATTIAAPAPVEWLALTEAERTGKWQKRIAALAAIAALGAGTWFGPLAVGWNFLASFAVVGLGGWLLVRRTRSYICFKTFFSIHLDYRAVRTKARKMAAAGNADPVAIKAIWDEAHERSAVKGYECVAQLQGLWVKMSQMMATRSDILPECYCKWLGKAQDQMPARGIAEIEAMLAEELGRPVSEVFLELVPEPLGCASIAQVHRAKRLDGTEVVVKLQHAGIEDRMAADILILQQILVWLKKLEPDFDMTSIARQWMAAIPEELDFHRESANMAEMRGCLARESPAPAEGARGVFVTDPKWASVEAIIPEVFNDISTRRVLVQRFEPGAALNAIDKVAEQLRASEGLSGGTEQGTEGQLPLLTSIARWYGRGLFLDGVFHADPHPGNFLLSARNKTSTGAGMPVLLDFGLVKHIQEPVRLGLARLVLGSHHLIGALADGAKMQTQETQDRAKAARVVVLEGFKDLGFPIPDDDTGLMLDVAVFLFRPSQTAAEAEAERVEAEKKAMDKVMATANDKEMKGIAATAEEEHQNKIALKPLTALPEELILFQRVLTLFRGLCTQHSVKINFIEQLAPFAVSTDRLPFFRSRLSVIAHCSRVLTCVCV